MCKKTKIKEIINESSVIMDNIMVSISCTTYNHEDYIADALESFLMQKTKYKYEILIELPISLNIMKRNTQKLLNRYTKLITNIQRELRLGNLIEVEQKVSTLLFVKVTIFGLMRINFKNK